MKKHLGLGLCLASFLVLSSPAPATVEPGVTQQNYEKSVDGIVVRNKRYFKEGSLELTAVAGIMPYDSLINTVMGGGRLTWHIADHYAWEIADLQLTFPSVTSFTTDTVQANGLSNLQTTELKTIAGTNFELSPIYGKMRFFGLVLYFDMYFVLGGGVANTNVLQFSSQAKGQAGTQSTISTSWDPMVDFGWGGKLFINRAMGIVFDLRDYVVASTVYGGKSL
jgi:outer membrane beta-barrel protein